MLRQKGCLAADDASLYDGQWEMFGVCNNILKNNTLFLSKECLFFIKVITVFQHFCLILCKFRFFFSCES